MTLYGLSLTFVLLFAASCQKEDRECGGVRQQSFAISDFQRISAGDNLQLIIKKGSTFSVIADGCSNDIADLNLTIGNGEMLQIDDESPAAKGSPVTFIITMPQLLHVVLSGSARATIEGFTGQPNVIRTMLSDASECLVSGCAINANFDLSGSSRLTLNGSTESLYGSVSGSSVLDSYGVLATEVDIATSGSAVAYVYPQSHFFASASDNSRIFYKGNPSQKLLETSGTALITQQ